jgi:hypothetical protein
MLANTRNHAPVHLAQFRVSRDAPQFVRALLQCGYNFFFGERLLALRLLHHIDLNKKTTPWGGSVLVLLKAMGYDFRLSGDYPDSPTVTPRKGISPELRHPGGRKRASAVSSSRPG